VIAIGAGIMTAINTLWIFSLGVAQIVEVETYKPLVYPVALVSLALCLASFPDNISYLNFAFYCFPILGLLIQGGLGLLLLIAALISGKKGKS
jgi:nitrate reductase NapE component